MFPNFFVTVFMVAVRMSGMVVRVSVSPYPVMLFPMTMVCVTPSVSRRVVTWLLRVGVMMTGMLR